jgi:hypothetical protein
MNIRDYYQKTSNSTFHASWISLVLAVIFFILHALMMISGNILWITAPFILLSIVQFTSHRIYEQRIKELPLEPIETSTALLQTENILLTFMPAPTLRLLLFASNGSLLGEIRDQNMKWFMWMVPNFLSMLLPKRYELVNQKGELLAKYDIKGGLFNKLTIRNHQGNLIGFYREDKTLLKINGMIYRADWTEWMPVQTPAGLNSIEIKTTEGKRVASYQTGWMPLDWGRRFKANTPILTFPTHVEENSKIVILGFFAAALHHRSN